LLRRHSGFIVEENTIVVLVVGLFLCSSETCHTAKENRRNIKMTTPPVPGKKKQLYVPQQRRTPTGVIDRIPVLATQALFRGGVNPEDVGLLYDPTHNISHIHTSSVALSPYASLQQVMSPVRRSGGDVLSGTDMMSGSGQQYAGNASAVAKQLQKRSSIAEAGTKAIQKLAAEINQFIQHEIGILATQNDGTAADMGPQRLAVYKAVFRMALPAVPTPLQPHLEAVLSEYDHFLQSIENVAADHTRLRERQRLESHFAQHFVDEARIKEAALDKRKQNFESVEAAMKLKLNSLEKQLAALQSENRSLRSQQNEDTERYSSMAQSVIESRLAASKAELALIEMKEVYEKVRMIERNNLDVMYDFGRMLRLLRMNNIPYDPRCQAMIDALAREAGM
jgi:flagellar motility protein MotE (MotC chaperone)